MIQGPTKGQRAGRGLRTNGDLTGTLSQEVEKSHPDLLQLSRDLEPPSQAAGWVFRADPCLSSSGPNP